MQSLTRTVSRSRTHTACTIGRTLTNSSIKLNSQRPTSASSPPSSPETAEDEPPTKTYAKLPTIPPTLSLSQEKLRHLIALYHSSSSFITPETLSDEIDKAFAPMRANRVGFRPDSYQDLVSLRKERATEPDRVIPTANEMDGTYAVYDRSSSGGWSASQSERGRAVKSALWGVDPMGQIGLETLLEAKAEMDVFRQTEEPQEPKKEP
ncbi:hypothetical protein RhiJN_19344 [Ceratobasidium sp. AG-Ba]|nr:hypothetical protein RhiJN_19344 [Ceratobasidium sp. AG-Ba]